MKQICCAVNNLLGISRMFGQHLQLYILINCHGFMIFYFSVSRLIENNSLAADTYKYLNGSNQQQLKLQLK